MTDEQINIAIAEQCGWKNLHKIPQIASLHSGWSGIKPDTGNDEFIPDYCNDLNDMHEVEVKYILVDGDLTADYWNNLYDTTESTLWPFASTARQRAEAFLKTINKWEDS
jgi:hypothetical protein